MRPGVVLRAVSGPRIGAGHVRRSRAVACALAKLGAEVSFVVDDEASARQLAADGFAVELASEGMAWTERGATAAWLDGFGDFSPELLRLSRAHTRSVLVENRTQARHFADHVVYPAMHWHPDAWDREHESRVAGGVQWVPLAPEFGSVAEQERDVDLLVTFGGSDPLQLTERVLARLDPDRVGSIAVTVGWYMAERRAGIESLAARFQQAHVLAPDTPLSVWMARSRAAVTALGTTLYELAHLRTPAWILANYESDHDALDWYATHGPHRTIGVAAEVSDTALQEALGEATERARVAAPVVGLGGGAARLALLLLGRRLTGRVA